MSKFHINPATGEPGACSAQVRCPFGGDESHYSTADNARKAFELSMAGETLAPAVQKPAVVAWEDRPLEDRTNRARHNVERFIAGKGMSDPDADVYMAMPPREQMHRKFRRVYAGAIEEVGIVASAIDWNSEESVQHFSRSLMTRAHEYREMAKTTMDEKGYYYHALSRSLDFLAHSVPVNIWSKAMKDPVYS